MIKIYGILNCDTIKKTLDWFKANKISYEFHDYKKEGITVALIKSWVNQQGLDTILNKKSATWRGLSTEEQLSAAKPAAAIKLMVHNTSLIKRPVIEYGNKIVIVGFNKDLYDQKLKDL